jgi:hypothetical protein
MGNAVAVLSSVVLMLFISSLALGLFFFERPRIQRVFTVSMLVSLGIWVALTVIDRAFVGQAMEFSRHYEWFSRSASPLKFWLSVTIHLFLAFISLWYAHYVWHRPLNDPPRNKLISLRPSFLRVIRWPILALALAAACRFLVMLN